MALADLAAGVRQARGHQALEDIYAKGGPSPNTVGKISRFDPATQEPWPVRAATLAALNAGIDGWKRARHGAPGTAEELYERPAEARGLIVTDVDEFADLVGARVLELLATRLQISLDLADAAQSA